MKRKEKKRIKLEKKETKKYSKLEIKRVKAEREAIEKEIEEPKTDDEHVPNLKVTNYFERCDRIQL